MMLNSELSLHRVSTATKGFFKSFKISRETELCVELNRVILKKDGL